MADKNKEVRKLITWNWRNSRVNLFVTVVILHQWMAKILFITLQTPPVRPQVWNRNAVKDQFMGQVVLSGLVKDTTEPQRLQLRKQGRQMADEMPGTISLRIVTSNQLTDM